MDSIPERNARTNLSAVRGRGYLVAFAYPGLALIASLLWGAGNGWRFTASLPLVLLLIALAAVSERVAMIAAPRTQVSVAAGFIAAAALAGGPLAGLIAGASTEAFTTGGVWRKRFAWAGASALEGLGIGIVAAHFSPREGLLVLVTAGLAVGAGLMLNVANLLIVGLDRGLDVRAELASSWRPTVLTWVLPWPALAAFLYVLRSAPAIAAALAGGLFLALWVGNQLRLRLEQSLAEERLRSRTDALTGAPNRYALREALAAEHARIMRGGRPGAVCFIDLDRFRDVNNRYGYTAGDELLVGIYQRFREHLRTSDQLFRWGGEEFVVIAPDQPDLFEFAERLRRLFSDEPFTVSGRQLALTGSVGAALLDETRMPEAALETASRLVRVAKERRDSIEVEAIPVGLASPLRAVPQT